MRHFVRSSLLASVATVALVISAQPAFAAATAHVLSADRTDRSTVQATVSVTCDPVAGAIYQALFLTIFQGKANTSNYREGQGGVGLEGINGLVCDSSPHTYTFPVRLTSFFTHKMFTPGPAGAEWFVQVCTQIAPGNTFCAGAGGPAQEQIKITP